MYIYSYIFTRRRQAAARSDPLAIGPSPSNLKLSPKTINPKPFNPT